MSKPSILSLITLGCIIAALLAGCDVILAEDTPEELEPVPAATNTPRPRPTAAAADGEQAEWLVMLYMDADDEILEEDIFTDLNEAERVGSTDQVHIVAQMDRYDGGFDGDRDWTGTRRYYLTQDPDLKHLKSKVIDYMDETNMADGATLTNFISWAVKTYPAKKHALILSDHGMGWPGGYFDPDPGGEGADDIWLVEDYGDGLWLMELDRSLEKARRRAGLERFELIGFDACLMSGIEVYTAMEPHARYAVASQEVEPGLGWAYASFLIQLVFNPEQDGAALAQSIVDTYIYQDEIITDEQARLEFVAESRGVRQPTAEEVAEEMAYDITLSAVDLQAMVQLNTSLDELIYAMAEEDQDLFAEARAYAQSFETSLDEDLPSPFIDLGHFASLLIEEDISPAVDGAAEELLAALDKAVIAEKHGPDRAAATGISLYFPVFDLYDTGDNYAYTTIAAAFTDQSEWDEYLDYHFTNRAPEGDAWDEVDLWASDTAGSGKRRAGAASIEIEPLELSGEVAGPGAPVTLDTLIRGEQVAYLYVFIGRVLEEEGVLLISDIDYLAADETQTVNGVTIPDWSEAGSAEGLALSYDFEPLIYALNDGVDLLPALFMPDEYGDESATYVVAGQYEFANGSPARYAHLYFRDGELQKVVGFARADGAGAPRQITPRSGDRFTVWDEGLLLESEEDWSRPAGTLTFGESTVTWEEIPAPAGIYVVGIIAEDFDGNQYAEFVEIEVEE